METPIVIKALPYICAALLMAAVYTIGHVQGTASCEVKNAKLQLSTSEKGIKEHDKIERKVLSLTDDDLDKRLDKWLRR